jgi:uncharacterized protein
MALNLPSEVREFLRRHHVMSLATQDGDGPWAAAVFYVPDGDGLIFLSSPASRHGRSLALHARCAAAIHGESQDWSAIQGIQLEGDVGELTGAERELAQQRYAERFPFVRPGVAPAAIAQALGRVRWYRLRIARLYFIDNRRGFGQREEFEA